MEIKQVQKGNEIRNKIVSVRTYKSYAEWMSKNKVSPSKLFNLAIEELMEHKR